MTEDNEILAFFMTAARIQAIVHTGDDICTCGGDLDQPADHHDISCPLSLSSPLPLKEDQP